MAAALLSSSRRHLSTAAPASAASVNSKLRKVFDPDEAIAILSSTSDPTSSSARFALDIAVRRLSRSRRFADVQTLIESRRTSYPKSKQDEHFLSTLILTYGTAAMLTNARNLFDEIPQPTVTSFNALLSACVKSKKPNLVPSLFADLPAKHGSVRPDAVSYGILIKSLCLAGKVDRAVEALNEMKEKDIKPTMIIYTTLVDAWYKKGRPEEAGKTWDEMGGRGIKPDVAAYNVKAMYQARNGTPEEVREVMKEMEAAGLKPDAISYTFLITCYCKNGRFEEAKEAYKEFRKKSVTPNAAIFKLFVRALCEYGDFDGGLEVCRDSMRYNKIPDFNTMKVLVEGLVEGGRVEEAKEVIKVVKGRFPESLLSGWKKLEKQMGLGGDREVAKKG